MLPSFTWMLSAILPQRERMWAIQKEPRILELMSFHIQDLEQSLRTGAKPYRLYFCNIFTCMAVGGQVVVMLASLGALCTVFPSLKLFLFGLTSAACGSYAMSFVKCCAQIVGSEDRCWTLIRRYFGVSTAGVKAAWLPVEQTEVSLF